MSRGGQETEIKLRVPGVAAARSLLRRAGFRVSRRRVFEANTTYDTAERSILGASSLLRIRTAGKLATVTFKGAPVPGRHKTREELELEVSDAAAMAAVFDRLGLKPGFRYEKYRTEFRAPGGAAMLDETPIGVFLELEGPPEWIDRTADAMGFRADQYITASYGGLWAHFCERFRQPLCDMTFANAPKAQP
jgi:adenylate cyclase, class 2